MAFSSLLCFPVAYVLTSCTSQDIKKKFDAKEAAMLDIFILSFAVIVFGLALYRLSEAYKVLSWY
jgi:Ni,Fe-hydrogenase I cytochrome b subunit